MSGYTKIPNWILDEVMPKLSPHEFKVYLCLYRQTEGWNKVSDAVPVKLIMKKTGLTNRNTVISALKSLEAGGYILAEKAHRKVTVFTILNITSDTQQSITSDTLDDTLSITSDTHLSITSDTPQKKLKENNNNRHAAWFAFFEGLTGFTPPNETTDAYQDNWVEPLEAIIKQSKDNKEVEDRITYAVMEMRKKDFTIKSIKSIKTFALNFQEKTDNGIEPAWLQVKEHVKQNKPPANGKLLTAVKAVGWPALKTMNSYTEKKLKQQFTEAYCATN